MHRFITMTITLVFLGLLCTSNQSSAGDGEALFESLKCGACHKPDQKAAAISLERDCQSLPGSGETGRLTLKVRAR